MHNLRKIGSKEEDEKKNKRNRLILALLIGFIMVFSTFATGIYLFGGDDNDNNNSEEVEYNGYNFFKQGNFWVVQAGEQVFALKNNPNEVPKINSEINLLEEYSDKVLYVYSEDDILKNQIYMNFYDIVLREQDACLEEDKNSTYCDDEPVKTCSDNFIIIKKSSNSNIEQKENCLFIFGNNETLSKIADAFILKVSGIEK